MIKRIYIIFTLLAVNCLNISADRYADLIADMPNMTFDQAFFELMEYQKTNPSQANTYLQLAIVSEHKMVLSDPLRDFEQAQYWADNANLFFGNFRGFYPSNDAKSHEDLYLNFNIQHEGKHITDDELMAFVDQHATLCKNFKDSTALAFKALEASKGSYNKCIATFRMLCDNYQTLNEMLLRYDDEMAETLKNFSADFDQAINAFAEYKKITKTHHILNYRQLYDLKPIETFRLDGLTNSDFLANHFTMWDFRKWIDDFNHLYQTDITNIRTQILKIDQSYKDGTGSCDELFFFQLGKYDNNSLVRDLFRYLDSRRELIEMATENTEADTLFTLSDQKMRRIYNVWGKLQETKEKLDYLDKSITPEKVELYRDFFKKSYGGEKGLRSFAHDESEHLLTVFQSVLDNFSQYCDYIQPEKANEDSLLKVTYLKKIKGAKEINLVQQVDGGYAIALSLNEMPTGMIYSDEGKEIVRFAVEDGQTAFIDYNDLLKVIYVGTNELSGQASLCKLDSIDGKVWEISTELTKVFALEQTATKVILIGQNTENEIVAEHISALNGDIKERQVLSAKNEDYITLFRASATQIDIFTKDSNGKMNFKEIFTNLH